MATFILIYFGLCLFTFFPSFAIVNESWTTPKWEVPAKIRMGDMLLIPSHPDFGLPQLNSENFSLSPKGDKWIAIIGVLDGDTAVVYGSHKKVSRLGHPEVKLYRLKFPVVSTPLKKANKLRIPASTWETMDDKYSDQKANERSVMAKVMSIRDGVLPVGCFKEPLSSKVVSLYGSPRTLPNGRAYHHTGVDLRAATGTPIFSMGRGEVVFAGKMIVPGNVVVIHHGGGLFSRYLHLNKIEVKVGDQIDQAALIGASGSTGRVEAPHLHWEVVWKGNHANPHHFVQEWEQLCDQS